MTDLITEIQKFIGDDWNCYFSRPVKETEQAKLYKKDKGYMLVVNAYGISKEDLKVSLSYVKTNTLAGTQTYPKFTVSGEHTNKFTGFTYKVNFNKLYAINEKIKSIKYDCSEGVCVVFIEIEQPEKPKEIEITPVMGDFDW